jgi:hypothetical protein
MKTSNVIIATLVVVVLYLSYSLYFIDDPEGEQCSCEEIQQELKKYTDFLVASEKEKANFSVELDPEDGELFTNEESRAKMNDFIAWNRRNSSRDKALRIDPYGFGFGINKMNTFIDKINQHNCKIEDSSQMIVGIRSYLTKKDLSDNPNPFIDNLDILMVPVFKNGGDPINNKGNKFMDTDTTRWGLNTSLPCPRNCQ